MIVRVVRRKTQDMRTLLSPQAVIETNMIIGDS